MHCTTKALVLRGVDYKESDRILTLLTRDMGKVTVSARGCRKKNSPLSAGCQLLCWSEFVLYQFQDRWTVKECSALREFRGMRTDHQFSLRCGESRRTEECIPKKHYHQSNRRFSFDDDFRSACRCFGEDFRRI